MKKIILLTVILMLCGCYDYSEIDDIAIITGIILDYKDSNYEIIAEVLENENESKTVIYNTNCDSIDSCILKISKESNKELYISHLKALILTDRTVNKKSDFYDFFLRSSKSKMNYYIYYVDDEYKDRIFNGKENISIYLQELIDFNTKNYSSLIKLPFTDMIQKQIEEGIDNIYPNILINEDKIYIDSLISFNDNKKIKLNSNESVFYNFLANNTYLSLITIPCDNDNYSLLINNIKSKYNYDNNLNITINVNAKLSNYNCKLDLNKEKTIKHLENLAQQYIVSQANHLINFSKENDCDFLGLSRYVYKHSKKKIKLKDINVKTKSKIKITSTGESR